MMSDETISETAPLIDLGVDSLVAVEMRTWFAQEVGADVAVLKILGGSSIADLVDYVMEKLGPSLQGGSEAAEPKGDNSTGSSTSLGRSSTGSPTGETASQTSLEGEAVEGGDEIK